MIIIKKLSHKEFLIELKAIHGERYELVETYCGIDKKIKVLDTFCNTFFYTTPYRLKKNKISCPKCKHNTLKTTAIYKEDVYNLVGSEYLVIGEYTGSKRKILMYHELCNQYFEVTPNAFLKGNRCSNCFTQHKKNTSGFQEEIDEKFNFRYTILSEYESAHKKIHIFDKTCGHSWEATPHHLLKYSGCPLCKISKGERRVYDYLYNNNINFIWQYRLEECRNKKPLPFDFCIFDTNFNIFSMVEYDGKQHTEENGLFASNGNYKRLKINDNIKNEFCQNNKIKLLRISYKDFNKIESILNEYLSENGFVFKTLL